MKTFLYPPLAIASCVSALAGPPITHWNSGNGSFYDPSKWSHGVPGDFLTEPSKMFSLTQFTGPWYSWTDITINNGTSSISPGVRTVYNVIGVPEERYSMPYFVNFLSLPWVTIGDTGGGGLSADGGMSLNISSLTLGKHAGSSGTLTTNAPPGSGRRRNIGSTSLTVGSGGIGRLNITGGSVAEYCDDVYQRVEPEAFLVNVWRLRIGEKPGSNGYITINGAGSKFAYDLNYFSMALDKTTGLMIGEGGVGGIRAENGGSLKSRAARLGVLSSGEGYLTVTGANSRIDNDAQFYIGEYGKGSLLVSNGGLVRSGYGDFWLGTSIDINPPDSPDPVPIFHDYGSIGKFAGSEGSVLVNGAGSLWENNANLIVGESGTGSLILEGGGKVASAFRAAGPSADYADVPNATLGLRAGSNGTALVKGTGSRWQNGSALTIGAAGTGKLTVGSGGTVDVGGSGVVTLGQTGSGTLIFGGNDADGVGTLGGTRVQGGAGNSTVQFQHNLASYTPTHRFDGISTFQNIGPGKTVVPQLGSGTGVGMATAGILEIGPSANESTPEYLGAQTGGKLVINGTTVRTPDVAVPRTLVGLTGGGEISVINGGTLNTTLLLGGAPPSGGTGRLTIEGEGSRALLRNSSLVIGGLGDGWLTLKSAGSISSPNPAAKLPVTLGESATGSGILSLSGFNTQFTTGPLTVGDAGRGTIYADDYGALLQSDATVIGAQTTGEGFVRLNNNVSWRVGTNELIVGGAGKGTLELATGASLRVGPQGNGDLVLANTATGQGVLKIGSHEMPGTLLARYVTRGLASPSQAQVRINHRAPDYTLSPAFIEVDFRLVSGNLGTTTLTSPDNFLSYASVTSGGLRLAGGGGVYMDDEIIIGDGEIFDMDESNLPFLEVDGASSMMNAANGIMVGKSGDGEIRLKNGGTLIVRNTIHQAENSVILGNDAAINYGTSSLVFGGSATTAPGILDAMGIHSYASEGKLIFNHSSPNFIMPAWTGGNLSVSHLAGTTLLTGTYHGYTGTTSVAGGTLLVTANLPSIVTLTNAAEYGGLGTTARVNALSGTTISPGTFRPGEAIADMRITALNFYGGSKVRVEMGPNLTCDKILNHKVDTVNTTLFPVTSGFVTFEFRDRGINRNGAYPVLTTTNAFTTAFMSRLAFTSNFPLQGSFRQTPVTSGGVSYHQLEFVVTSFDSSYSSWVRSFGLDPLGNGAPGEDADHDGLKNLLEYVLGSSPISGVPQNMPTLELNGSSLIFSFISRPEITGTYTGTVEYSTDLKTWTAAVSPAVQTVLISGQGLVTTATLLRPTNGKPLFARLRVNDF